MHSGLLFNIYYALKLIIPRLFIKLYLLNIDALIERRRLLVEKNIAFLLLEYF
jgi:hypothetical protein